MFVNLDIKSWTIRDFINDYFKESTINYDKIDLLS